VRVLIDARWVALAPNTSHARYLRALAAEWAQLPDAPSLVLVGPGACPADLATSPRLKWLAAPDLPGRWRQQPASRLWSSTVFTAIAVLQRPDVLFFPWSAIPRYLGAPAVVTVHDVCFRSHPERFADGGRSGDAVIGKAACAASVVLTPSAASKAGLVAAYALDERRVQVVPHGIAPIFSALPSETDACVLARLGIESPYVLCVSTHEPRKNLDVLLRAFVQYAERDGDLRLVLVGRRTWHTPSIVEPLATSRVAERVHLVDGLSDAELASLYRLALAAMLPSVCEGFGFPLLEALACGTPVVASDLAVFRELADHAALYVPWHDAEAWAAAFGRVATDVDLKRRARQGASSIGGQYDWRSSAAATLRAFNAAVCA
jgi:glycosyltransferase involved in cell wall biosynthesis